MKRLSDDPAAHLAECRGEAVPPAGDVEVLRNRLESARARFSRWNGRLTESLRKERLTTTRLTAERDDLQSELTKARELIGNLRSDTKSEYLHSVQALHNWAHRSTKVAKGDKPTLPAFALKIISKLQRFEECTSDSQGADIGRHWFDLLTQLGLLNRVQRSPALWEITQQGEDALAHQSVPADQNSEWEDTFGPDYEVDENDVARSVPKADGILPVRDGYCRCGRLVSRPRVNQSAPAAKGGNDE